MDGSVGDRNNQIQSGDLCGVTVDVLELVHVSILMDADAMPCLEFSYLIVNVAILKIDEDTVKLVLLENGNGETYWNGEKGDGKWKLVGNEVHFVFGGNYSTVHKFEPDGDLKLISEIEKGKRLDYQKEDQLIYKKLK